VPEQRLQLGELVAAAHERAGVGRQPEASGVALERAGELVGERLELRARPRREVVVPVLGQELAAVERERGPRRMRAPRAEGGCGRVLEALDVDVRHQHEQAVSRLHRPRPERLAGDVDGLVEVVRGRGRIEIGPEGVHRLLAVEPVAPGERQELHELARLLQPPGAVRHRLSADRGREAAEKPDRDARHRTRMTGLAPGVNASRVSATCGDV
jgi:hypothetical protein